MFGDDAAMPESLRPTLRRRRLGRELRRIREERGWSLEAAAPRLGRTYSSLGKIERGEQGLTHGELVYVLDQYGATDPAFRESLLALRRDARKRGWWVRYQGTVSPALADLISLENDASRIRVVDGSRIPGFLQTEDYIRALLDVGVVPCEPDDIEMLVSMRLRRQEILLRSEPVELCAVIPEAVLHQRVGGRRLMRTQLERLLESYDLPSVSLQVLPASVGASPAYDGPFMIFDVGDRCRFTVVRIECLTQGWYLEDDWEVSCYTKAFEHIRRTALSPSDTQALIRCVLSEL